MPLLAILGPMLMSLIESWFSDSKQAASAKTQLQQVLDTALKIHEQNEQTRTQAGVLEAQTDTANAQANVLLGQETGNTLQRDWIPILMYMCTAIVAGVMIFLPILHFFVPVIPLAAVPDQVWTLMEICLGGMVGIHGINKIADTIFNNDKFFQSLQSRMGRLTPQQMSALRGALDDAEKSN